MALSRNSFFFLLLMLLLNASASANAQSNETKPATAVISAAVYDELIKAQEAQEKGDISTALSVLDGLKNRSGRRALTGYEQAQMWNFYAYAYLAKEDYKSAIQAFEQLLKQADVPQPLITSTQYTVAQLYFAEGNVNQAISLLERWFKVADNPAPDAYVLLAQMYIQNNKIDAALSQLLKALEVAKTQKREEKENWYALLQYVYAEKQQYSKQVDVLEVLVNRWPKRNYWLALMGAYAELGQDKKQLAAMDAAYIQGMLDQESYLIAYAQLLSANQMPYQAAKVLQQGLDKQQIKRDAKNLKRLGDYYRRAQEAEKALTYLQEAANLSSDGEVALRLAYVYSNRYKYKETVAAVRLAMEKGGLAKPVDARFLMAQAQFHLGQYNDARENLTQVVKAAQKSEAKMLYQQASQWLNFVEAEIKRQQEIAEYLNG